MAGLPRLSECDAGALRTDRVFAGLAERTAADCSGGAADSDFSTCGQEGAESRGLRCLAVGRSYWDAEWLAEWRRPGSLRCGNECERDALHRCSLRRANSSEAPWPCHSTW